MQKVIHKDLFYEPNIIWKDNRKYEALSLAKTIRDTITVTSIYRVHFRESKKL